MKIGQRVSFRRAHGTITATRPMPGYYSNTQYLVTWDDGLPPAWFSDPGELNIIK